MLWDVTGTIQELPSDTMSESRCQQLPVWAWLRGKAGAEQWEQRSPCASPLSQTS